MQILMKKGLKMIHVSEKGDLSRRYSYWGPMPPRYVVQVLKDHVFKLVDEENASKPEGVHKFREYFTNCTCAYIGEMKQWNPC